MKSVSRLYLLTCLGLASLGSCLLYTSKRPEIAGISNFMSPSNLQYNLNVNTEQATLQNMNVDEIYATIQALSLIHI